MIKAYIFDMDGVLCDSEPFIAEAAIRMFKERYSIEVAEADFIPFIGAGEDRYIGGVAKKYGIALDLPRAKAETYRLYAECVQGKLQALPGVKTLIEKAAQQGILLAVATSADEVKMTVNLQEMGLEKRQFDALVNGVQIKHKKPAPDIFLEAARRLGVEPSECIVFEDAITGVQAAKAAGARCIGITSSFSPEQLLDAGADEVHPGFEKIKTFKHGEKSMRKPQKTWITKLPKIGIRPVIDGRYGGMRESLEEQVMDMAKVAAELIRSSLKYPNGDAVECVIADTCIGGVAEAAACAEKFDAENVGVSLTVTSCWCYGSETMDMDPLRPKAVWGFNGTERPGAVYLAAVLAAYAQKGLPAFGIYGHDVQDAGDTRVPADVEEKLLRFVKAGLAVAMMKGKSYLSMGGCSMGIAGSIVDQPFFEDYLNMRVEVVDLTVFTHRMRDEIYDPEEYERALAWVKQNCKEGEDTNCPKMTRSREKLDAEWEDSVKMALITRDLMYGNDRLAEQGHKEEACGHNAIAAGFQGQRQWTDAFTNGDFLEAISNSSFDWNGTRMPRLVATENDAFNAVPMLFGHLLTNTAQVFADVRTYWSPAAVKRVTGHQLEGVAKDGFIHLINSGSASLDGSGQQSKDGKPAMKPFWEISEEEAQACLDATTWYPSNGGYFPGGGWSSQFLTKGGMPVTMSRVNLVKGLGPVLQIAEGWTVELPEEVHHVLDERTDKTWPTTWFAPRLTGKGAFTDVYEVMANWGANHGAFSFGHIGADLITLASMLRIPVFMHNVEEAKVYRPAAWSSFGTDALEGADFRACQAYGSVYG